MISLFPTNAYHSMMVFAPPPRKNDTTHLFTYKTHVIYVQLIIITRAAGCPNTMHMMYTRTKKKNIYGHVILL